ncbi:MAG: hypothetical protein IPH04_02980 [Saprospirales bacterium]|nr:hypothetical protein [Saprospirales bacterium]
MPLSLRSPVVLFLEMGGAFGHGLAGVLVSIMIHGLTEQRQLAAHILVFSRYGFHQLVFFLRGEAEHVLF